MMTATQLRNFLLGRKSPLETLDFLSNEFLPAVVERLNESSTRRLMALYGGDRVPENERNLTDVRNRISLLIEYKMAWIGNEITQAGGVADVFWANVVANRFPDLEIRNNRGFRGLRIEVKCLQAVAEEKAANFDTLKKDLHPNTDYVVVFIWEWFGEQNSVRWDRAPKILRAFVFHASSLAELRDYAWLEAPPKTLGNGFQGFDFRYAVNCQQGTYKEEEGNYGKLLRIWSDDSEYRPGLSRILDAMITTYRDFRDFAIWSGFEVLAQNLLAMSGSGKPEAILIDGRTAGYFLGNLAILFRARANLRQQQELANRQKEEDELKGIQQQHVFDEASHLAHIVVMNDKYQWVKNRVINGELERSETGRKPKHLVRHLAEN